MRILFDIFYAYFRAFESDTPGVLMFLFRRQNLSWKGIQEILDQVENILELIR